MPTYVLKCSGCGNKETVICMVKERNSITCKCGCKMAVQIVTANFRMRDGRPDVLEWKKQRGVLDL